MSASEARKDHRVTLMRRVRVRAAGPIGDATILDASPRGLLMTSPTPPQRGEIAEVFLDGQVLVGQVRWTNGPRFGIGLRERLDVRALASGRGSAVQSQAARAPAAAAKALASSNDGVSDRLFYIGCAVAALGFLAWGFHIWG